MKKATEETIRQRYIQQLFAQFKESEGDCDFITSNSFNFPISEGEEEGWVEIIVKVPTYDDEEGYSKRDEYQVKLEKARLRAEKKAKQDAEKIKKDKQKRLEKQLQRDREKKEVEKLREGN